MQRQMLQRQLHQPALRVVSISKRSHRRQVGSHPVAQDRLAGRHPVIRLHGSSNASERLYVDSRTISYHGSARLPQPKFLSQRVTSASPRRTCLGPG
ncbi:hypothetical protein DB31_7741 [Hyalangium minutum]|uniref:Uncharacterized protein n=1 Tax=Hyalangium minutum TaxID=394096 RepID=A0A085WLE1_9BACT|nr:hypothetical protein DB31_7741 [Hyalangium minutum]